MQQFQKSCLYATETIFNFSSNRSLSWLSLFPSDDDGTPSVQAAVWAPAGRSLAVVHGNDVFYVPDVDRTRDVDAVGDGGVVRRITNTGKEGIVFNGVADWLYEGGKGCVIVYCINIFY